LKKTQRIAEMKDKKPPANKPPRKKQQVKNAELVIVD
jgi:hypothetical protein